ncbi:helix-turn-helix transcriptional regulator [Vampirovibrio sp.]|uniref:helix-turn-helix transcriptional regulator n=1 Tax=Vampirovibrio sp. TaxID=2717857 RepID=UPI00359310C1
MRIENLTPDEAVLAELGSRIARYRLNRDMTQEALAKAAGISIITLKRIENGEHATNIVNIISLLRALKLLDNLELILPSEPVSPLQQMRTQKKSRKRASSRPKNTAQEPIWTWGEET